MPPGTVQQVGKKIQSFVMSNVFKPNDPNLHNQWHLINTGKFGSVGNDANVLPAWQSVTGKGVVMGVGDDGMLTTHPDLKDRYRSDLSFDFDNNDPDPTPEIGPEDGELEMRWSL